MVGEGVARPTWVSVVRGYHTLHTIYCIGSGGPWWVRGWLDLVGSQGAGIRYTTPSSHSSNFLFIIIVQTLKVCLTFQEFYVTKKSLIGVKKCTVF